MSNIVALYLVLLAIITVGIPLGQVLSGREELISLRNFFIFGLVIFQITGAAISLFANDVAYFQPADVERTSVIYAFMLTIFVILFLSSYRLSTRLFDRWFAPRDRGVAAYSRASLLIIAGFCIPVGLLFQYVLINVPVLGPGFRLTAYGLYAVAAGLAAWAAAARAYNPIYLVPAITIILMAAVLTFAQNFGRRDLLGVVAAVMWATYFGHWRSLGLQSTIKRMTVVGGVGLVLMALVTSARSGDFREQSALQNVAALREASIGEGVLDLVTGQRAGLNSMWLIESRPESKPYDTLHSFRLMLFFPIPRTVWPNKPDALAITMPKYEVYVAGKPPGWNIGPGVIGHIANDNPLIALWLYPITIGVILRFFDRATQWFHSNPFVVIPIGAAIGQVIAMPRGELGSFFFAALLNILLAFLIMRVISACFKFLGLIRIEPYGWDEFENADLADPDELLHEEAWEHSA